MPEWRSEIRRRLTPLRLDAAREEEIVDELSQHLDDRYDELRARGIPVADAERVARAELDDDVTLGRLLEPVEQAESVAPLPLGSNRGGRFLATVWHDLRYGARTLRRSPGFTVVAALTLALGIGANTLIFSVVNTVLLRPLAFSDPDRLVAYWGTAPEKGLLEVNFPEGLVAVHRSQTRTMQFLAGYSGWGATLTGHGDPERLNGAVVTADFFRVLGNRPLLGRTLLPAEDTPDNFRVAVLSYGLWQRRFGGDSAIVGKGLDLSGTTFTVVGVMAPGFAFPNRTEIWVPQGTDPTRFNCWCLTTIGRLKPGFTADDAQRDIASVTDQFGLGRRDIFPDAKPGGARVIAKPLARQLVGDVQRPLYILLAAVGLVLLVACANLANLLLARAGGRGPEMALRCCLGATPRRIAAQLLTESLLLSLLGATVGVMLATWGTQLIRGLSSERIPRIDQVRLDAPVLAFASGLVLLTTILFGLAPALRASRMRFAEALKDGGRGGVSRSSRRLSNAFVVCQFGLSLILLAGAGLVLRSFRALLSISPGFRTEGVLVARLALPYPRYANDTVVRAFYGKLLERAGSLPGVAEVGTASRVPLTRGNPQDNLIAEGRQPRPGEPVMVANFRQVSPGYFDALGTPVVAGRRFQESDASAAPPVAMVDETLARRYWPNETTIGKRIRHGGDTTTNRWMTIVGVTPNVKHNALDELADLQVYEPFAQRTTWGNYLVVRSSLPASALLPALRREVAVLDPALPLFEVHTMREAIDNSLTTRRLTNVLLAGFAIIALCLAGIGIYGVISLGVHQRSSEFGIRIALGAKPASVLQLVVGQGLGLAAGGVALGLVGAFWLTRFLGSLLYGVGPWDLPTFLVVAVMLTLVALAASLIPARRATRVDPMTALRTD